MFEEQTKREENIIVRTFANNQSIKPKPVIPIPGSTAFTLTKGTAIVSTVF